MEPGFGTLPAIPRKIRVQYPGAIYHLMSRGDHGDDIYLDDVDRQDFLKTLAEACQKTDLPREISHEAQFTSRA